MTLVNRTRRLALVAGLLLVGLAAISPTLGSDAGVNIVDKSFSPATITVAQGTTVTWTVTKAIGEPHTVTSGKLGDKDLGSAFNSQTTDPNLSKLKDVGGTFAFTFDKPGTYDYLCTVHSTEMTGQVIVLTPGQTPPATTAPTAAPVESGIPAEKKLLGAGILVVTLVILFGSAIVWRRMNPA
jgi:plastocyanin